MGSVSWYFRNGQGFGSQMRWFDWVLKIGGKLKFQFGEILGHLGFRFRWLGQSAEKRGKRRCWVMAAIGLWCGFWVAV